MQTTTEHKTAIIGQLLSELDEEARTTRLVLGLVRDEHLAWRPHPRARTLGQLALHVAQLWGGVAALAAQPEAQAPRFVDPDPSSAAELIPTLDASIARAKELLGGMDDATVMTTWRLKAGDRELLAIPRIAFLRSILLNHAYHHRGQLTVYLRMLGERIPSIYGPSADENPFVL
jgi:uncharacterized damage-inducible protein DinB